MTTDDKKSTQSENTIDGYFEQLVTAFNQIIWTTSADGSFIKEQPSWANFTGQSFAEYEGYGWVQALHPDDREQVQQAWGTALESQSLYKVVCRVRRYDGEYRHLNVRALPLITEGGELKEWTGIMEDITERKQITNEISHVYSMSTDMVGTANFDGYFKTLNPAWEQTLGYTIEELLAKPFIEFVHPDDRADTLAEAEKIAQGATVLSFENRYHCKDGSYKWLDWKSVPDMEAGLMSFIARDITERKQTEVVTKISITMALATNEQELLAAITPLTQEYSVSMATLNYVEVDEKNKPTILETMAAQLGNGQPFLLTNFPTTRYDVIDFPILPIVYDNPYALSVFEDGFTDPRIGKVMRDFLRVLNISAFIAIPMVTGERWQGVIFFNWSEPQTFSPYFIEALDDLRTKIANMVTGRRAYLVEQRINDQLKRSNEELAAMNEELQAIQEELLVTNQQLTESEERYALGQRAANMGSWDWHILKNDVYWSDEIEPLFGFKRGEFGKTYEAFLACIHPEDRQSVQDVVTNSLEDPEFDYNIEHRIIWPDGTVRWMLGIGDTFRDDAGKPIRMLGAIQDITERKQAELAYQQYAEITRKLPVNVLALQLERDNDPLSLRIIGVNERGEQAMHVKEQDVVGLLFKDVFPEWVNTDFPQKYVQVAMSGEALKPFEFPSPNLDTGDMEYYQMWISPLPNKSVTISYENITQRKVAEEELWQQAQMIDQVHGALVATDLQGIVTGWYQGATTLFGYTAEEAIGQNITFVYPPETHEFLQQQIEILKQGDTHKIEVQMLRKSGEQFAAILSLSLLRDREETPIGMLGYSVDITERKEAEAEREGLRQEVIEAQQRALQELSVPIIPLMEGIIVMPLIGSIDSMRARDLMRTLLKGINDHRAKIVILDITGVAIVDTGVAASLDKTIQAARLKGAHTIITGVSDAVAETIVDLGIDWSNIETLRDLQTGLVTALQSLGIHLTTHPH